jgi:hypothetical protein
LKYFKLSWYLIVVHWKVFNFKYTC